MPRLALLACTVLVVIGIKSLFGASIYSVLGTAAFAVAVVFSLFAVVARIEGSSVVSGFDIEEMGGKVQATLLRVLRRHRVLRG